MLNEDLLKKEIQLNLCECRLIKSLNICIKGDH